MVSKNKLFQISTVVFAVIAVFIAAYSVRGWVGGPMPNKIPVDGPVTDARAEQSKRPESVDTSPSAGQSRFNHTLSNGPDSIREALSNTADATEMNQEIQNLFMEAWHVAKTTGNFDQINDLFLAVEQKQRYVIATMLPMVFSKLGPEYDIPKKLDILENLSDIKTSLDSLERQIYQAEAKERYDEMQKAGIVGELSPENFAAVIQAVGGIRLGKAFERVADGGTEEAQRRAAAALGRYAMRAGTMEGSEEIAKLQPGIIRDEAVAQMVIWMNQTGSGAEAAPWLETIQDPVAKARATPKPKPKSKKKPTVSNQTGETGPAPLPK